MTPIAKRVLNEASNDDQFVNLSDGERLVWMIERAHALGVAERHRPRKSRRRTPRTPRRSNAENRGGNHE